MMEDRVRCDLIEAARTGARAAHGGHTEGQGTRVAGYGIYVVSTSDPSNGYRWEIRNADGTVFERSLDTYRTSLLARCAGMQAMVGDECILVD